MVRVLRYLADCGGSADSGEIRRGVPAYEGESGHRAWRRDLRELRARGVVAAKTRGEEMSSRVELVRLVKPQYLFLTRSEHEALAEVEDRLRRRGSAPLPLPGDGTRDVSDMARLARYLEERPGQDLTYAQVEQALGLGRDQLTGLLRQIVEADEVIRDFTRRHPGLDWIDYSPPDDEDPDGTIRTGDTAAALGEAWEDTLDPRDRTGQLGFFAYTAAEADDRIGLIVRALGGRLDLSDERRRLLQGAGRKLRQWRTQLPQDPP